MTGNSRNRASQAVQHRLKRKREMALQAPDAAARADAQGDTQMPSDAWIDCGWGRLIFAQTFTDPEHLVSLLRHEEPDRRDICFYVRDPHVLLGHAPLDLFLDPSHTYQLDLSSARLNADPPRGFVIRKLGSQADAEAVNRIYASCGMVSVDPEFFWKNRDNRALTYLVAEDTKTGEIIGSVTGVDHERAFDDPERRSSLWCLAVDHRASHAKIGEALTRHLAAHFAARGRRYMDLSVIHDNESAIRLYERMGFERAPTFTVKRKNPINEKLFTGEPLETGLNPYARIIVDEARRRGIAVDVLDAEGGFFRLSHGGRAIVCREALSELTSAIAMSRCDDKAVTRRLMTEIGLTVAEAVDGNDGEAARDLLDRAGSVVVKPSRGEQGRGVTVDIRKQADLDAAIKAARTYCPDVLVETFAPGDDLRIIVIGGEVVAAALRKRPTIHGDGKKTVRDLIEGLSRRRAASTDGESVIPFDGETERCVGAAGFALDDVLPSGRRVEVRGTANLHTDGTLHDVTDILHPKLAEAARAAADAIDIPVAGLDFIVEAPDAPDFVFIEANERPGLANHEPQPTAERFIDLLFPQTIRPDRSGAP